MLGVKDLTYLELSRRPLSALIEDFIDCDEGTSFEADVASLARVPGHRRRAENSSGRASEMLLWKAADSVPEPDSQKLCIAVNPRIAAHRHPCGRARIFGGTTTLWGGQACASTTSDFRSARRPLQRAHPFPARNSIRITSAERILSLGLEFRIRVFFLVWRSRRRPSSPRGLYIDCSRWSPKPNFGTALSTGTRRTRRTVQYSLHTNVASRCHQRAQRPSRASIQYAGRKKER